MALYRLIDVFRFLTDQKCSPTGDAIAGAITFETEAGYGFTLPVYDREWIDADLVDDILANRWIVPCAPALERFED